MEGQSLFPDVPLLMVGRADQGRITMPHTGGEEQASHTHRPGQGDSSARSGHNRQMYATHTHTDSHT